MKIKTRVIVTAQLSKRDRANLDAILDQWLANHKGMTVPTGSQMAELIAFARAMREEFSGITG